MAGEVIGPSRTTDIFLNKHHTQMPSTFVSIPIIDYTGLELIGETLCSGWLMETLTPGQHTQKECLWGAPHQLGHLYHPPPPHYLANIMEAGRVETAGARDWKAGTPRCLQALIRLLYSRSQQLCCLNKTCTRASQEAF